MLVLGIVEPRHARHDDRLAYRHLVGGSQPDHAAIQRLAEPHDRQIRERVERDDLTVTPLSATQRIDSDHGADLAGADVVEHMPRRDDDSRRDLEARSGALTPNVQNPSQVAGHARIARRLAHAADRSYDSFTRSVASPDTPPMITLPLAEIINPNSTSTPSGRAPRSAAAPIICAVDAAISTIACHAWSNASTTRSPAPDTADVGSVPATGTVCTNTSTSPTRTGIVLTLTAHLQ